MVTILTTPNPVLRKVSKPVEFVASSPHPNLDTKTLSTINDVQETLKSGNHPKGVGLSAVQIGNIIRVFCVYLPASGDPDDEKGKPILCTYINPEIIETSTDKTLGPNKEKPILEGCLSIPGIWGPVSRHSWIKAKWQMENGQWKVDTLKDFPARVFQHELDHLNGILFTDHSLKEKLPLYQTQGDELIRLSM